MPHHPLLSYLPPGTVVDGVADRELAWQYAQSGDKAAFELLVRRHADTVWTACKRILRDHQAAEDAFQATFLALAQRAGSIRTPCVAGWLYRVAVRASLRLRTTPVRQLQDRLVVTAELDREESAAVIHEEVARLAEKYRLPVILCDLNGLTHAEAATQLGWPVGTVSGRLSQARSQLRSRLTVRGYAQVVLVAFAATDRVSAAQIHSVVSNAVGGIVPPAVADLTHGVLHTMFWYNSKLTAVLASATLLLGSSLIVVFGQAPPVVPVSPPARAQAEQTDPIKKLQKERLEVLKKRLALINVLVERAAAAEGERQRCKEEVAVAEAELEGRTADLRAIYDRRLKAAQEREKLTEKRVKAGAAPAAELLDAQEARLDISIAIAKLPAK